ncbi:MAG: radical SAM protein [Clostridia bacterium]|nr:radical SAM protein [Clostridia bacterium]
MHEVQAKSLLSRWNSMNVYRGCTHGCIYCDSRSACYQFSHRFEDIEVKVNAPDLLEQVLRSRREKCLINSGSMSDPYQPLEEELQLTKRCLELLWQYGFGAGVLTKSDLVLRDIDLLHAIHERAGAVVQLTLTCADDRLSGIIEPNVVPSSRRYEVLKAFQARHIPTVVWMDPILPFLTDNEKNIRTLLEWCADAGVYGIVTFGIGMTLREGSREYYYRALNRHFPGLARQYVEKYGDLYEVMSPQKEQLAKMVHEICEKYGIRDDPDTVLNFTHTLPERTQQLTLFDLESLSSGN